MNVHTPERQHNESREQYAVRRAVSRELNHVLRHGQRRPPEHMELTPSGKPAAKLGDWFLGQHENRAKRKRRVLLKLLGKRQVKKMWHARMGVWT